jgi:hypothetical protein
LPSIYDYVEMILKKRCSAPPAAVAVAAPSTALGFVEVTPPHAWPLPTPATEIDRQRADGARPRIICQASQVPVAALAVHQAEMNHHRISHLTAYSNARPRLARSAL